MTRYKEGDKVIIKKGAIGMWHASERKKVIGKRGIVRAIVVENGKNVYVVQIGMGGWLEHFRTDALRMF